MVPNILRFIDTLHIMVTINKYFIHFCLPENQYMSKEKINHEWYAYIIKILVNMNLPKSAPIIIILNEGKDKTLCITYINNIKIH